VYAVIIIVAIVEGPILAILFGVLIKAGAFPFWPIYFVLMAGDVIGDIGWYYVGRNFGMRFVKRFGKYFGLTEEKIVKVTKIFHKYHYKILVISKLTSGFGFAVVTLMVAGMTRIPFAKYMTINFVGQFVWTGFLIAVGYFLSSLYTTIDSILGKISLITLAIVVLFALNAYRKYVGNQMSKNSV
jgi:membrane protein DedA with SNARE-associated domain